MKWSQDTRPRLRFHRLLFRRPFRRPPTRTARSIPREAPFLAYGLELVGKRGLNHLLEVASLVADATHGRDPELVIAALLHDAIEDQEVPSDLIAREFGDRVAALVTEVTDDKSLDKAERKRLQVDTRPKKVTPQESSSLRTRQATRARLPLPPLPTGQ